MLAHKTAKAETVRLGLLICSLWLFLATGGREVLGQNEITIGQCRGDRSLPVIAEIFEGKTGIKIRRQEMASVKLQAALLAGIEAGSPAFDAIWGCWLPQWESFFEGPIGEAFRTLDDIRIPDIPDEMRDPRQRWLPVTVDVGVVCTSRKSGFSNEVLFALTDDLDRMFSDKFKGRIGFWDPILVAEGYNWMHYFGQVRGYDGLVDFAKRFAEQIHPKFEAGCSQVRSRDIDVAFSTWFDARNFLDEDMDFIAPNGAWVEPNVFAILADSPASEHAQVFVDLLFDSNIRVEIERRREILVPIKDLQVTLPLEGRIARVNVRRGPAGSRKRDREEVAGAAAAISPNGCQSEYCKSCPARCRLCKHCVR